MSDTKEACEIAEGCFDSGMSIDQTIGVLYDSFDDKYRFYISNGHIIMEGDLYYSPAVEVCKIP